MSDADDDRYDRCRHCAKTVRAPLEPGPHIHTGSGEVMADHPFIHRAEPEGPVRKLVYPNPPQPKGGGPPPS